MSREPYAHLRVPRAATFDVTQPQPAVFLARLLDQALNHGLPVQHRGGRARAALGRRGLPTRGVAAGLRLLPRRASEESDALVREVRNAWPDLAGRSETLPSDPPPLSVLTMDRTAARTSFVFGADESPLMVVKQSRAGQNGVEREARFLEMVESATVAPRVLGRWPGTVIQEGLAGAPPRVLPVTPADAHLLAWYERDASLRAGLERLASCTVRRGTLQHQLISPMDRALSYDLSDRARRRVRAARADLAGLDVTVVQHKDLSAQNWLVDGDRLVGVVDWEMGVSDGVPGFDSMHVAVASLEHGVGLTRWSDRDVTASFRRAWFGSSLFEETRAAVSSTVAAAGVEGRDEQLWVAYFARRLGRRLAGSQPLQLGVPAVAAMLETVCSG